MYTSSYVITARPLYHYILLTSMHSIEHILILNCGRSETMWGFVNILFWIFYKWNCVHNKSIFSKNCLCGIDFHHFHNKMRSCGSRETLVATFFIKKITQIFKFPSAINTNYWMQHNSLTRINTMPRFQVPSIYASFFWSKKSFNLLKYLFKVKKTISQDIRLQ